MTTSGQRPFDRLPPALKAALGKGAADRTPGETAARELELLAALEEGTLGLEDLDADTLERMERHLGRGFAARRLATQPLVEVVPRVQRAPGRVYPLRRMAAYAAAASLALALGLFALLAREREPLSFTMAALDRGLSSATRASFTPTGLADAAPQEVFLRGAGADESWCLDRVVGIDAAGRHGSGVLLDGDGWIVTTTWVVEEAVRQAAFEGRAASASVSLAALGTHQQALGASVQRVSWDDALALLRLDAPPADIAGFEPLDYAPGPGIDDTVLAAGWGPSGATVERARMLLASQVASEPLSTAVRYPELLSIPERVHVTLGELCTTGSSLFLLSEGARPRLAGVALTSITDPGSANRSAWVPGGAVMEIAERRPPAPELEPFVPWTESTLQIEIRELDRGFADGITWIVDCIRGEGGGTERARSATIYVARGEAVPEEFSPARLPGRRPRLGLEFEVFVNRDAAARRIAVGITDRGELTEIWCSEDGGRSIRTHWVRRGSTWETSRTAPGTPLFEALPGAAYDLLAQALPMF